ncbi:response regulator [bacterium]|nr:response regulator [bacterium]
MTSGSASPMPAPSSSLRLLVVDDEPMLRSVIEEFLTILGYTQHHMAGDGQQALEVLRNHPIDCILSDIRMPELELEEMLGIVRKQWPDSVVIATSGYSDMESAANIIGKGAADFFNLIPNPPDRIKTYLALCAWNSGICLEKQDRDPALYRKKADSIAAEVTDPRAKEIIQSMHSSSRPLLIVEIPDSPLEN